MSERERERERESEEVTLETTILICVYRREAEDRKKEGWGGVGSA